MYDLNTNLIDPDAGRTIGGGWGDIPGPEEVILAGLKEVGFMDMDDPNYVEGQDYFAARDNLYVYAYSKESYDRMNEFLNRPHYSYEDEAEEVETTELKVVYSNLETGENSTESLTAEGCVYATMGGLEAYGFELIDAKWELESGCYQLMDGYYMVYVYNEESLKRVRDFVTPLAELMERNS